MRNGEWKLLSADEKLWWHSYVYAFNKVFLQKEGPTTADPEGIWRAERLIAQAEAAYKTGKVRPAREQITPAMRAYRRGDYETAQLWDDQDRERRKAEETPEYIDICMRQIRANLKTFASKTIR